MKIKEDEVKKIRDERQCTTKRANHLIILKNLQDRLKDECTTKELQGVLIDIVAHADILFIPSDVKY